MVNRPTIDKDHYDNSVQTRLKIEPAWKTCRNSCYNLYEKKARDYS